MHSLERAAAACRDPDARRHQHGLHLGADPVPPLRRRHDRSARSRSVRRRRPRRRTDASAAAARDAHDPCRQRLPREHRRRRIGTSGRCRQFPERDRAHAASLCAVAAEPVRSRLALVDAGARRAGERQRLWLRLRGRGRFAGRARTGRHEIGGRTLRADVRVRAPRPAQSRLGQRGDRARLRALRREPSRRGGSAVPRSAAAALGRIDRRELHDRRISRWRGSRRSTSASPKPSSCSTTCTACWRAAAISVFSRRCAAKRCGCTCCRTMRRARSRIAVEARSRTPCRSRNLAAGPTLRRRVGALRIRVHAAAPASQAHGRGARHPDGLARQCAGGGIRLSRSRTGSRVVGMRVARGRSWTRRSRP